MKKIFFFYMVLIGIVLGDAVDDKIEEIIGSNSYTINKSFIENIFRNKANFYVDGQINIATIIRELKNNGLLVLKFPSPLDLNISFVSQTSPILLVYTINNVLSSMGYSYFMVSQSSFINGFSNIRFSLNTEHALDPTILIGELQKRGFKLTDIKKKSMSDWEYFIESKNPQLFNAKPIAIGNTLTLREVSGKYWLNIQQQGNLVIKASNKWIPKIICYNKDLQITKLITQENASSQINIALDGQTRFVMITDAINPNVIKDQIEVALFNF